MQRLIIKRKKLKDELNGILAGMNAALDRNDANWVALEIEAFAVAQKIKRITFVINKVKRQRREKKCQ